MIDRAFRLAAALAASIIIWLGLAVLAGVLDVAPGQVALLAVSGVLGAVAVRSIVGTGAK